MAPKGIGLSYENISDDFKKTPDLLPDEYRRAKASHELDLKLNGIDPALKSKLDSDLDEVNSQKTEEQKKVISSASFEAEELKATIADLNNDLSVGTDVKRAERYSVLRDKQEDINQYQKDVKSEIAKLARPTVNELSKENANLLISFIDKGVLAGVKFRKGLRDMYIEAKFPIYKNASKAERKEMREKADRWASGMKEVLERHNLWDDAKVTNRYEKKEDRVEKRAQRKTEYNETETIFTEEQFKNMLDTTAMIMGRDAFAKALYAKIIDLRPNINLPKWDNMAGLNQTLDNPNYAATIRGILKENLPYMTVSSLQDWLSVEEKPGEMLTAYKAEIEKQHAKEIDTVLQELYPNITQDQMRKKRAAVAAGIAVGVMQVTNQQTGMEIKGAGLGGAITFSGLDRVQPIISRISIGVGVANTGAPGFAIDFGRDFKRKTGGAHLDAGVANIVIPFARVGIDQSLFNNKALQESLRKRRVFKVGAYAEAAPGYAGVGINVGNNLMEGINRQQENIERSFENLIASIDEDTSLETAKLVLKSQFSKANDAMLTEAAQHILDGIRQGYAAEDIAATYAAAWKNEAIKDTRGKVDVNVEAGVGMLMSVPVLKAFVGLKIYKRSTMLTDKYDRDAKEQKLSTFRGYQKFDNADVKNMSHAEKIAYWLGDKVTVSETTKTITITAKDINTPIYDIFDIYAKDKKVVRVTANEVTFSKGSNILMGKLISSYGEKQKIYIGYDKQKDIEATKFPLNGKLSKGNPELVPYQEESIIKSTSKEMLRLSFEANLDNIDSQFITDSIRGKISLFEEMTHPSNKNRLTFNKQFGEFVTSTRSNDFALMKSHIDKLDKMSGLFTEAERKTFDTVWEKSNEHKRALVNSIIQTGSYSARLLAIVEGKGLPGSKNLGELLKKRTGHIEAFKNSGITIDKNAFAKIYENAKEVGTKKPYTETAVDNAVALVGYYRSGLTPTTGLIGFGDVHILSGAEYRENASKETAVFDKFMEIYMKSADFASQKATMQREIEKFIPGAKLDDADVLALIKTGKLTLNGSEITMTGNAFEKILNGPCANEGYMMSFGKIELTTEKEEKIPEKKGEIYVGMETTENYQKANSINVGVGAMYGNKPKKQEQPEQPPEEWENGTPESEPGDDVTPTDVGDNNVPGTVVGDDKKPTDVGDADGGE